MCVQVAPLSLDRHTPPPVFTGRAAVRGNAAAYTVVGVLGSSSMWLTPRDVPKLAWMMPALFASVGLRQVVWGCNNAKVAPPSVDFQIPYGGSPGAKVTTPPDMTALTPRTPRTEPTYIVLPSTTIDEIDRPSKAGPLYAGAVCTPPKP